MTPAGPRHDSPSPPRVLRPRRPLAEPFVGGAPLRDAASAPHSDLPPTGPLDDLAALERDVGELRRAIGELRRASER